MPRSYREHRLRAVTSLDGTWDFAFLGATDPDVANAATLDFRDRLPVPGCFDAMPRYAGLRGLAGYRTRVNVLPGFAHRLVFNGVNHWCRVFADGVPVGEHAGGFTRFSVNLPAVAREKDVEVLVLVSNAFDLGRNPLHDGYFDWYQYGGITRSVELHRIPPVSIQSCRVDTLDYHVPRIHVRLSLRAAEASANVPLTIICDRLRLAERRVDLPAGDSTLTYDFDLPDAAPWSPQSPNLHLLGVEVGADDLHVRFGIRQVAVAGTQITINGAPLRLLGVNRHEFHPHFGHALPDAIIAADVQQLRNLGCNFVRGGHYPQDERFLDLCDEAGLCVWVEGVAWQIKAETLVQPAYIAAQSAHLEEMVAMSANHPSVVMWGVLNESDSNRPESVPVYEQLIGRLKSLDPTRPVTYATFRPATDLCLHLADVVSVNTYPGWYFGDLETIPAELDKIAAQIDAAGGGEKPLIISEIGAGAIPGWRDSVSVRWTESYQAALLETVIGHLFETSTRFAGLSIWLFNDFRTPNQTHAVLARPRGYNDKGIVDEYRRPKLAYEHIRERFRRLNERL